MRAGTARVGRARLILVGSLALVGCTGADAETDQPVIVATTIIVGDLAAEVAGDEAIVEGTGASVRWTTISATCSGNASPGHVYLVRV